MIKRIINRVLGILGFEIRKKGANFYLHEYSSYEEYKQSQVFYNKKKIHNIWADEVTLNKVIERVQSEFPEQKTFFAICHGTRNGFEQNYIAKKLDVEIIGTDISDTASQFPKSVQWDFHNRNELWVNSCDFVYTNSLDQSWKPQLAVSTWLEQLKTGGLLFVEHTEAHNSLHAGFMDPFGVDPQYMPYVLCDWFKHSIAIEIINCVKSNNSNKVWLFVIKKL